MSLINYFRVFVTWPNVENYAALLKKAQPVDHRITFVWNSLWLALNIFVICLPMGGRVFWPFAIYIGLWIAFWWIFLVAATYMSQARVGFKNQAFLTSIWQAPLSTLLTLMFMPYGVTLRNGFGTWSCLLFILLTILFSLHKITVEAAYSVSLDQAEADGKTDIDKPMDTVQQTDVWANVPDEDASAIEDEDKPLPDPSSGARTAVRSLIIIIFLAVTTVLLGIWYILYLIFGNWCDVSPYC